MNMSEMEKVYSFLKEKGMITELIKRSETSRNTVLETFKKSSTEDLKGKQLLVYMEAMQMIEEIKSLPSRIEEVLNNKE